MEPTVTIENGKPIREFLKEARAKGFIEKFEQVDDTGTKFLIKFRQDGHKHQFVWNNNTAAYTCECGGFSIHQD